ncbi:MAG TPA: ethanolamine ammonia-lyase subunit EutB [Opitutus sp.]|nr:ethanolamine ammonia-lyase subunit EutB [Opitutus sp.]
MSTYRVTLRGTTHTFASLRELLAKATPLRSGDELAGLAAANAVERAAAQHVLADVPLSEFLREPLIPYETDEVTRLILDSHIAAAFAPVRDLSVGQFREWLLRYETTGPQLAALAPGLTPEMVAAVSKLMRNQDLVLVAAKCEVVTRFRNTLGLRGRLATRLQPNHPTDDPHGIAASILDGLLYGCGDAVIGINPAADSPARVGELLRLIDDLVQEYGIPTQSCVLAHLTTQLAALRAGAPADLLFQSIAGTEAANTSFGVNLALLREARDAALSLRRGLPFSAPAGSSTGAPSTGDGVLTPSVSPFASRPSPHVMYFETGQGSCLSADAHHDVDQQTLEARAYAVARAFSPLLVNTVVGFIGPEYLYDGRQIIRAGLEDHFCGKLLGLPMGVDICYTNHAEADQDDMDTLLTLLGAAGVNYIMGVPGADDIMLGYQSTSFHDAQYLRQILGRRPAPEFEAWLGRMNIARPADARLLPVAPTHPLIADHDV